MAWSTATATERDEKYTNIYIFQHTRPLLHNIYVLAGAQSIKQEDGWGTALRKVFLKGLLKPFLSFHRLCYVHPERAVALVLALAVIAFFAWPVIAGFMGAIVASTVALGASAIISSVVGYATVGLLALIGVSAVGNVQAAITKPRKGLIGDPVHTENSSTVESDTSDSGSNLARLPLTSKSGKLPPKQETLSNKTVTSSPVVDATVDEESRAQRNRP